MQVCLGPAAILSPSVQTPPGVNCRRSPPRPAIARQLASPTRCLIGLRPRCHVRAFPSLHVGGAGGKRARTSARSSGLRRSHRAGGITPIRDRTSPAVKTSNPCLTPRGARSAVGGIRAWAENSGRRASSRTTVLLSRAFVWPQPPKPSECDKGASARRPERDADAARPAGCKKLCVTRRVILGIQAAGGSVEV